VIKDHKFSCRCIACKAHRGELKGKEHPMYGRKMPHISKAHTGKGNPMYGKHHAKKSREQIRRGLIGKSLSITTRKKMSLCKGGTGIPYENSEYNEKFSRKLKEQIRKRDNYKCQNCGMTEKEQLSLINRVLHVHHIDYNKHNCDVFNLLTLCLWCNLTANFNRKFWTKKFKDHLSENTTHKA